MKSPTEFHEDGNRLVGLTSFGVLGVGLAALFLGVEDFWLVFVLGFGVLVPMVATLTGESDADRRDTTESRTARRVDDDAESPSKQDALDTLRDRYARGDLTEAEFERKVEVLLDTETTESARERVEGDLTGDRNRARDLADERAK